MDIFFNKKKGIVIKNMSLLTPAIMKYTNVNSDLDCIKVEDTLFIKRMWGLKTIMSIDLFLYSSLIMYSHRKLYFPGTLLDPGLQPPWPTLLSWTHLSLNGRWHDKMTWAASHDSCFKAYMWEALQCTYFMTLILNGHNM